METQTNESVRASGWEGERDTGNRDVVRLSDVRIAMMSDLKLSSLATYEFQDEVIPYANRTFHNKIIF